MEARRKLEYGFQGYQAPPLPRAVRSMRRQAEGWRKKHCVDSGRVFLDLLATVAGEFFEEREIEKTGSAVEEIVAAEMANEKAENRQGEAENSPKQTVLDLQSSERLLGTIQAGELTVGDTKQRLGFKDLDYGCSYENAMAAGVAQRKPVFKDFPINEDPDVISQNVSRSTSCIGKRDFPGYSSDKKKGPDLCINSQVAQKQQEAEGSTGANGYVKAKLRTDACEEDNVLSEQSLLTAEQDCPDLRGKLAKQSMGVFKNHEGENDIDEINSGWQQMGQSACENAKEVMQDAHPLHTSSWSSKVPTSARTKPPLLANSATTWKAPLFIRSKPSDSFIDSPNDRTKFCRDDDDNSSECAILSTVRNKSFKSSYIKEGKVRRATSSKFRREASASLNKRKFSAMNIVANTDKIVKSETSGTEMRWTGQRTPSYSPLQRKKQAKGIDGVYLNITNTNDLDTNGVDCEPHDSPAELYSAKFASVALSPRSSFGSSKHSSKKSDESYVKLSIKSFTVPELFIDVPESATVANLKRAVMEAAINLLQGRLQVSVLLHGKKVTDEGATLVQVGISHGKQLDAVGFMLESNSVPGSCTDADNPLSILSRAAIHARYPLVSYTGTSMDVESQKGLKEDWPSNMTGMLGSGMPFPTAASGTETQMNQQVKSEFDTVAGLSCAYKGSNSGAFAMSHSVRGSNGQELGLVPLKQKSQGAELNKRRLRRPFTVAEVEVLIEAVEKLGTGRWREIKLHAFDHAKHRTYVDLKDKWKTLVHTAKISPHQRRGEPVPLELLDRVIRAHSYWTEQQASRQAEHSL